MSSTTLTLTHHRARIVDLNLLPAEQRPREVPPWALAAGLLFLLLVGAMVPLGIRARNAQDRADAAMHEAAGAEASLGGLQADLARERGQRIELADVTSRVAAMRDLRAAFQGGQRPLDDDLTRLWTPGFLPAGARLTSVTGTDGGLRVEGVAAGPLDAIAYADQLVQAGGFTDARLTTFVPAAGTGGAFSIAVTR